MASPPVESIIQLTQQLVRAPSRGGIDPYAPAASVVQRWLAGQGIESQELRDEHGALVGVRARVGEGGPCYVLNATLDTASFGDESLWTEAPTSGVLRDGWLFGRGSADSKSAVAIFCHIASSLRPRRYPGGVELLFDLDEHTGRFGGMRAWLGSRPENVAGVFIGYPGPERILIGSRGFWRARIQVHGSTGHSGAARARGMNAVSKAASLVHALEEAALGLGQGGDFPLPPKLTVTGVQGGGDFSLVPDSAHVDVDVRLTPSFDADAAEALVRAAVARIDAERPSPSPSDLDVRPGWPAYRLDSGAPLARALQASAAEVLGAPPPLDVAGPSNTGNLLAAHGIPATCGFGVRYQNIHAPDEAIDTSSLGTIYSAYLGALGRLLGSPLSP